MTVAMVVPSRPSFGFTRLDSFDRFLGLGSLGLEDHALLLHLLDDGLDDGVEFLV